MSRASAVLRMQLRTLILSYLILSWRPILGMTGTELLGTVQTSHDRDAAVDPGESSSGLGWPTGPLGHRLVPAVSPPSRPDELLATLGRGSRSFTTGALLL